MNIILSTAILSFALIFSDSTDKEAEMIIKMDRVYHAARSSSDLYELEKFAHESLKIFPESDRIVWRLGRTYFKLGQNSNSEAEKVFYFLLFAYKKYHNFFLL